MIAIEGFIITAAIKDIEDFHGLSHTVGNDRAALEWNGRNPFSRSSRHRPPYGASPELGDLSDIPAAANDDVAPVADGRK